MEETNLQDKEFLKTLKKTGHVHIHAICPDCLTHLFYLLSHEYAGRKDMAIAMSGLNIGDGLYTVLFDVEKTTKLQREYKKFKEKYNGKRTNTSKG